MARNDFVDGYLEHSAKGTTWEKTEHKYIERKMGKDGKWIYRYSIDSPAAENKGRLHNVTQPTKFSRELKSDTAAHKYQHHSNNKNANYREAEYQGRKAAEEQASRMRGTPFGGYQNAAEYDFQRTGQYKRETIENGKKKIKKLLGLN